MSVYTDRIRQLDGMKTSFYDKTKNIGKDSLSRLIQLTGGLSSKTNFKLEG